MKIVTTVFSVLLISIVLLLCGKIYAEAEFTFQNTSSFIDESNILHLYGELKNLSSKAMKNVVVKASFYDMKDKLLNEFQRSSELRTINPGETSPFEILYIDTKTVKDVKNYSLTAVGTETQTKTRELSIVSASGRLDLTGFYYINGKVINQGEQTATNSLVIATLYDKDGRVIALGRAQTEPVNITSSSEAPFGIAVTEKLQTYKAKRYSLLADSDQYVTIPDFSNLSMPLGLMLGSVMIMNLIINRQKRASHYLNRTSHSG
jgi:hypothetical protein